MWKCGGSVNEVNMSVDECNVSEGEGEDEGVSECKCK